MSAAFAPVVVGTAVAAAQGEVRWVRAALALVVALGIQVGTNYANDYSDGIRGTDQVRVGPVRLVAAKLATPAAVRTAAMLGFGVAALAGLELARQTSWWLIAVGAACIAAGWMYTGGRNPYGYAGLGEVFVFLFFGLVAVAGTAYVQLEEVTTLAAAAGIPVGLLATALIVVNNLRDIPTDEKAGKRTLAVRIGERPTRALYGACLLTPFAFLPALAALDGARWGVLVALGAAALAVRPLKLVMSGATGRGLIAVLGATGQVQMTFAALLAAGLWRG